MWRAATSVGVVLMFAGAQPVAQAPKPTAPAQPGATVAKPAEPEQVAPEAERRRRRTSGRTARAPGRPIKSSITADRVARASEPVQQTLLFDANVVGGYDDNVVGGGAAATPEAMSSGRVGTLDAALAYLKGNNLHAFRIDTTGTVFAYPDYLDCPAAGGSASLGGKTTVGGSTTFAMSQRVGYEPLFSALSPSAGTALPAPGTDQTTPTIGIFERRSFSSRTMASLGQQLGRRDSLSTSYTYGIVEFNDNDPGDNTSHTASAGYTHVVAEGARVRAEYSYGDIAYTDLEDAVRPATTHRVEGGLDFEHVISTRRMVTWSLAAGASRLETIGVVDDKPFSTWLPTGSGSLKVALSSSWSIQGSYRRDFSLLQGITNEVFASDTVSLTSAGSITGRTSLRLGGTYGNWQTPAASGANDTFHVYGAQVQLTQMLTDTLGVTTSYAYYLHRYSDAAVLPEGFPAGYDRNSIRVGITLRVPLIGGTTPRPAGR